jgi:hypothetical protein
MDALYQLLKEYTEIYKMLLELEYDKYEAVIKDDVITLDNIVSQVRKRGKRTIKLRTFLSTRVIPKKNLKNWLKSGT